MNPGKISEVAIPAYAQNSAYSPDSADAGVCHVCGNDSLEGQRFVAQILVASNRDSFWEAQMVMDREQRKIESPKGGIAAIVLGVALGVAGQFVPANYVAPVRIAATAAAAYGVGVIETKRRTNLSSFKNYAANEAVIARDIEVGEETIDELNASIKTRDAMLNSSK